MRPCPQPTSPRESALSLAQTRCHSRRLPAPSLRQLETRTGARMRDQSALLGLRLCPRACAMPRTQRLPPLMIPPGHLPLPVPASSALRQVDRLQRTSRPERRTSQRAPADPRTARRPTASRGSPVQTGRTTPTCRRSRPRPDTPAPVAPRPPRARCHGRKTAPASLLVPARAASGAGRSSRNSGALAPRRRSPAPAAAAAEADRRPAGHRHPPSDAPRLFRPLHQCAALADSMERERKRRAKRHYPRAGACRVRPARHRVQRRAWSDATAAVRSSPPPN